jgi:GTPase SAR1 family protein
MISSRYSRVPTDGATPSALDAVTKNGKVSDQAFVGAGSKPIVVIGDVGVGKSSFFENLYLSLEDERKKETVYLPIDLGVSATLTTNLKGHVLTTIQELLFDKYQIDIENNDFVRTVYDLDLKRFENSVMAQDKDQDPVAYNKEKRKFLISKVSDKASHVKTSLAYLCKGKKNRVILIIDNADQRDFETQQQAFLIAQEFAAMRTVYVFVALRPSTFYLSKMSGALSAYQNKILTISPPPADEVIKRRLTFALRVAEGEAHHAALQGIQFNLSSIVLFLRALLRSIRKNDKIQRFLGNITGGNTKGVIELITSFVGSPNVEAAKIVRIEDFKGDYLVPYHEFTKHALIGQYSYYNAESSLVGCNVFDVTASDPREHFLKPLIVAFCSSSNAIRDNDGFFLGVDIAKEMELRGFSERQIEHAIRRLAEKKLIETPYSHFREVPVNDGTSPLTFSYRVTSVGVYHIRYWLGEFSYLDAMSIDTPIFEQDTRDLISKKAASFFIEDRYSKAVAFREYLRRVWVNNGFENSYFDFGSILELGEEEFEKVLSETKRFEKKAG